MDPISKFAGGPFNPTLLTHIGAHAAPGPLSLIPTIDAASKALQSKAIDLSNASTRLQVCLEDLEKYRNEFGDLKTQANSIAKQWSINSTFPKTR